MDSAHEALVRKCARTMASFYGQEKCSIRDIMRDFGDDARAVLDLIYKVLSEDYKPELYEQYQLLGEAEWREMLRLSPLIPQVQE